MNGDDAGRPASSLDSALASASTPAPPAAATGTALSADAAPSAPVPSAPAASSSTPTTCGGGGGPNGGPADLFPCDSPWYKDVSADAVAAESDSIIGGIGQWGAGGRFLIDTSIQFLHDDGSAPLVNFTIDYSDESNIVPVPIPAGGAVEGETGYTCTGGGDCHLIVVQDSTKRLFELYAATDNGNGTWHAAQESVWDLTRHYGPDERGPGCTSADAAGLSVMAGLIGVRETVSGNIRHALRFILPNNKIRRGPSFVAPASHGTSATTSASGPPFGARLRLKSSFDESRIASTGGRAIVQALKKYGMFLADGGQDALTAEDDRFEKARDPSMTWQGHLDTSDLAAIQPSDFEVVDFGTVVEQKGCSLLP
jgi:serine/threonine-protein kinase